MAERKQLELSGFPRKRVTLVPDAPAALAGAELGDAKEVGDGEVVVLNREREAEVGYTEWQSTPPPCTGYWDVSVYPPGSVASELDFDRLWFVPNPDDAQRGVLTLPSGLTITWNSVPMYWRGLRSPWPNGYSYRVAGALVDLTGAIRREISAAADGYDKLRARTRIALLPEALL